MTQLNVKQISSNIDYSSYLLHTLLRVLSELLYRQFILFLQTNDAAGLCRVINILLQNNGYCVLLNTVAVLFKVL